MQIRSNWKASERAACERRRRERERAGSKLRGSVKDVDGCEIVAQKEKMLANRGERALRKGKNNDASELERVYMSLEGPRER